MSLRRLGECSPDALHGVRRPQSISKLVGKATCKKATWGAPGLVQGLTLA